MVNTSNPRLLRILLASYYDRDLIAPQLERLRGVGEIVDAGRGRNLTREELLEIVPGVHGVIAADEAHTREILSRAPELLIIARDGTGYDKIDLAAATELGVVVTRAPVVHHATANLAVGLMVALVRKIPSAERAVRGGAWTDRRALLCRDLTGMTLGLVGFGQVGREVAVRARAMGMRVLAYDIADIAGPARELGVEPAALDDLLGRSDVVSVHLSHTASTRGFFDARRFAAMKAGSYFLNTSRGEIVREPDLVAALRSGRLAGAALDVFDREPVDSGNPLLGLPNVVLTPHVAGDTSDCMVRAIEMNVSQILDLAAGRKPAPMLNPGVWETARIHAFRRGRI